MQVGGLILNVIVSGTQYIKSNAQWMIPFGLYFIVPTIVCVSTFFIEEVSI